MSKEGKYTSEYQEAREGSTWGLVATILGIIITAGSTVAAMFDQDTTAGIIAGAVVAAAGAGEATLVKLGYINSRTKVKEAESRQ